MIQKHLLSGILENNDPKYIEDLAQQAHFLTQKHFGNTITLYSPLYLANYCDNQCSYCGFHKNINIKRTKLNPEEIEKEMQYISNKGIKDILLLTGESRKHSPLSYILEAVNIGKKYFSNIGIEVYPMETEEYRQLFKAGVESVTIYQETYDLEKYSYYHLKGKKTDYQYRYNTPKRAAEAGIRMINMGVLFGLSNHLSDLFNLYSHLEWMQKHYPGVEYSISIPRIIPLKNSTDDYFILSDLNFAKIMCLTRILYPHIGINISTRESSIIRDKVINLGVTRISAESKTTVGGYSQKNYQDQQFDVIDNRSIEEIVQMLKSKGLDPVFTNWRRIKNS